MKYTTVQAVASRLKDHFHIEMDFDQIVIHSSQVLKNMGMIALQREVVKYPVENFTINLPGRIRKVRAAIRLDGLPATSMNIELQDIWFPPQTIWVSNAEDISTISDDSIRNNYVPQLIGPYIPFVWDCPYVRFNETDIDVALIVTSMKMDKSGYPMIPEEAFEACVYYCLYVYYQPMFILGKIDGQRMGVITEWKNQKMRFAESSLMLTELSQNEMNEVLNIMTSFDRKKFGIDA